MTRDSFFGGPAKTARLLRRSADSGTKFFAKRESRAFFARLEAHCLAPDFRYDTMHRLGDVKIWSNLAALHTAPLVKRIIDDPGDARLLYPISVKGEPSLMIPRSDTEDWLEANLDQADRSPT